MKQNFAFCVLLVLGLNLSAQQKIYFTERSKQFTLFRLNVDGFFLEKVLPSIENSPQRQVTSIQFDTINSKMYWTQWESVHQADLNGDNEKVLLETGDTFSDGLAIDIENEKLFYSKRSNSESGIYTTDFSGTSLGQVLTLPEFHRFSDLIFYENKILFISEKGSSMPVPSKIQSIDVDGTNLQTIFEKEFILAFDLSQITQKIYWSISGQSKLYSSNLDGTNLDSISIPVGKRFSSIKVKEGEGIYIANSGENAFIYFYNFLTGDLNEVISFEQVFSITDLELVNITGIENADTGKGIIIKPNPCSDYIELVFKSPPSQIVISDASGKVVLNVNYEELIDSQLQLSFLSDGYYNMTCIDKKGNALTEKFIKISD